ncbi:ABC transporter ATP-binding protein [Chloroflexota bacterium]
MSDILLEVNNLRTQFVTRWGTVKAVDDVTFHVRKGEVLGLVGESGSGKTVTCLSILRLVPQPAGCIVGGEIIFQNENLLALSERRMREIRGGSISMILQDPVTSLNPVFTIGNQIFDVIKLHQHLKGTKLYEKALKILKMVGISSPEERVRLFPHELSGGMKQRVVGAIAISCEPSLLIADEPTTSLDATIQAQYLRLLLDLQETIGLTTIFITHDFGVVARMCNRVAVMYAGKIVEMANVRELFNHPLHCYTEALMKSVPKIEKKIGRLNSIEGQPPSLHQIPAGCAFAPRCLMAKEICKQGESPPMIEVENGHSVRCWRHNTGA